MSSREDFIETLEACERTSAMLLLTIESAAPQAASLVTLRAQQIENLSSALPSQLTVEDIERLKILLRVGDEVSLRATAEKVAATRSLASLSRGLQIARQIAPARAAEAPQTDYLG